MKEDVASSRTPQGIRFNQSILPVVAKFNEQTVDGGEPHGLEKAAWTGLPECWRRRPKFLVFIERNRFEFLGGLFSKKPCKDVRHVRPEVIEIGKSP